MTDNSGATQEVGDVPSAADDFVPQPVLRPREQIERQVREAILSGTMRGGDRLPSEAELSRQFGVSRTTVREALRSLTAQNLIRKVPGAGGGSFVQSVTPHSLHASLLNSMNNLLALGTISHEEVSQVRLQLEVPAASLAARHRTEKELDEMARIIEQQSRISVDDPQVPELDARFHGVIADASGNQVLAAFVHALHGATEPVHFLRLSPEMSPEAVRQHMAIHKAIKNQDSELAARKVAEHLEYLNQYVDVPGHPLHAVRD
jgi:DNA-binding FadR family transcriptional regulator